MCLAVLALSAAPASAGEIAKFAARPHAAEIRHSVVSRTFIVAGRSTETWRTRLLHRRAVVDPRPRLNGRLMRLDYIATNGMEGIWRRATVTVTVRVRPGRTPALVRIANYGPMPVRMVVRILVTVPPSPPVEAPETPVSPPPET